MNVDVRIEELVLEGFPPGNRHRIGAAVERELTRLLAERGLPPGLAQGAEVPHLDGGSVEMNRTATPEGVGGQVAKAVYGGFGR